MPRPGLRRPSCSTGSGLSRLTHKLLSPLLTVTCLSSPPPPAASTGGGEGWVGFSGGPVEALVSSLSHQSPLSPARPLRQWLSRLPGSIFSPAAIELTHSHGLLGGDLLHQLIKTRAAHRDEHRPHAPCGPAWPNGGSEQAGQTVRSRRIIEAVIPKEIDYEVGNIPFEWEAWIRGNRKDPPTTEEILQNEEYRQMIKLRACELQQDEEIRKEKEYEEGLVARPGQTQIKGHASANYFGKDKQSSEPSSTANTFQPGSWLPPESSSKKK